MITQTLEAQASAARIQLEARHAAREEVLKLSRVLIQTCSKSIKKIHRDDLSGASDLIAEAKKMSRAMREAASSHPEVLYAGHIQDSEKELAEAACLFAILSNQDMPSAEDLDIGLTSWLNGLGEAASEARRALLDQLREGDHEEAQRLLYVMDAIYDELTSFDFPDALTGGLRRTCDALRAVIERTRSDLTLTGVQLELLRAIQEADLAR
jgi:translin